MMNDELKINTLRDSLDLLHESLFISKSDEKTQPPSVFICVHLWLKTLEFIFVQEVYYSALSTPRWRSLRVAHCPMPNALIKVQRE